MWQSVTVHVNVSDSRGSWPWNAMVDCAAASAGAWEVDADASDGVGFSCASCRRVVSEKCLASAGGWWHAAGSLSGGRVCDIERVRARCAARAAVEPILAKERSDMAFGVCLQSENVSMSMKRWE